MYLRNTIKFIHEGGQVKNIDECGLKKKIEIVNIFRIQVKMSIFFLQFQLKIDENNLNVNKKLTSFWGAKVLFKKIQFEQIVRVSW